MFPFSTLSLLSYALGLTLLIPHLLSTNKSFLYAAQLKIFTVGNSATNVEEEKKKYIIY